MKKLSCKSLSAVIALSLAGFSSATTVIFSDDFEDGNSTGWGAGAYKSPSNPTPPTQTTSIVDPFDGSIGFKMSTTMMDRTPNPNYAGTQVSSLAIPAGSFTGYALSDITMGFKFAVTADAGPASTVRFELRENSGTSAITTHAISIPVADIVGGVKNYSFTFDNNKTSAFTNTRSSTFDPTRSYKIFVQIQDGWGFTGSTRNIDLTMDDFSITAVPEPGTALLGLFGAGMMVLRRRR